MKDYNLINQRATTCKHGGHCEWVACDKCNHYEPDVLNQQPCEDCISRQTVLDMLEDINAETEGVGFYYEHYVKYIKALPSVTPKKKTGHWEYVQYDYNPNIGNWHCSECRRIIIMCVNKKETGGALHKYCPNCGVKMVEPQESEDKE